LKEGIVQEFQTLCLKNINKALASLRPPSTPERFNDHNHQFNVRNFINKVKSFSN